MGRVFRVLGVLLVVSAALVVVGVDPASAAPAVVANPSTGLVHGQTITVSGSGYSPGTSLAVVECQAGGTSVFDYCKTSNFASTTADSNGSFTTTYTVSRIFTTTARGTVDCADSPGNCLVAVSPFSTTFSESAPLAFDPNGPLPTPLKITVTDVTAAVRDNKVLLQGTVTCTVPTQVYISGRLRQTVRRFFIDGYFQTSVACDGKNRFAVAFEGQNGVIKKGQAKLDLTASGNTIDDSYTFTSSATITVSPK